jgi:hypothetical protein
LHIASSCCGLVDLPTSIDDSLILDLLWWFVIIT